MMCFFFSSRRRHTRWPRDWSSDVCSSDLQHPLKAEERIIHEKESTRYRTSAHPVAIGDNVCIGGNTVIFPGITIWVNVTIGAGSVVTKDLPFDVLAFGNPCRVQIEILSQINHYSYIQNNKIK